MKRCFVVLSLLVVNWSTISVEAKPSAPKKKAASSQNYSERFGAINKQMVAVLQPLSRDMIFAYHPDTPPERAMNLMINMMGTGNFEMQQSMAQTRAQKRKQFLDSPEGKSWVKKRADMRQTLTKNFPSRAAAIRRATARMRAISPVPKSLKEADNHVISYSLATDVLLDKYNRAMQIYTIEGLQIQEQVNLMGLYFDAAVERIDRYESIPPGKIYIDN